MRFAPFETHLFGLGETCNRLLTDPGTAPNRTTRINQARRFSWEKHADIILGAYEHLGW